MKTLVPVRSSGIRRQTAQIRCKVAARPLRLRQSTCECLCAHQSEAFRKDGL